VSPSGDDRERITQGERHRRAVDVTTRQLAVARTAPLAVQGAPPLPGQRVAPPDPRPVRRPPWSRRGPTRVPARADGRRVPSFLVLGAQKAGTTWLHAMLGRHPAVFLPGAKELHYLDHRRNHALGIDWYAAHFADAPAHTVLGEATPNYLWASGEFAQEWTQDGWPGDWKHGMPERALAGLGRDLRLVVLLREPVARAVSAFHHHLQVPGRLDPDLPFTENVRRWGIAHMGFYAAHLERWLEVFPREQVHVRLFEELIADPQPGLDAICDHVGVGALPLPDDVLQRPVHRGSRFRSDDGRYWFDEDHERLAIDHDDLALLREVYAPQNERLATLLGRDLTVWATGG
jgi:hypothetical protein